MNSNPNFNQIFEPFLHEMPIDDVVNQIGIGKFHYKILFLIYLNSFQQTAQCSLPGLILPSLKKEFDLSKTELSFYGSLEFLGFLIASLTIGSISDKLGRRNGILIAQLVWLMALFLSVFSPNIYVFSVLRCIVSTSHMVVIFSGFSLVSEIWPQITRGIVLNCIVFMVLISFMTVALLARILMPDISNSDWRPLVLIYCSILSGSIFLNYHLLEEIQGMIYLLATKYELSKLLKKWQMITLDKRII